MSTKRCLVVEDSALMRQMLVLAIGRVPNVVVTEATDGLDALRKLAAERFDIVVTDVNMPIMDGLKLVRRIRTDPHHKHVPILIVTTEGASEDRRRALELGATAYIVKPIQSAQVVDAVREHLGLVGPPP
ncbi:MAG: response regulator [Myxococcales bacterium]|jgi:two-component system chemotaxis response regulator CheY|nr:response regulator [Myxococcales bacterium]MBL0193411.1 response regulator [Myxococcales bacterium]HQY62757.1 response regulator [Polyangiaceae bacterium]